MAISGNPRKALPKGIRVVNSRNYGAFTLHPDGVRPSNPETAHVPLERGGVVYSRQGAKINLPLGGLSATRTTATAPAPTKLSPTIPKAADYLVPRYIPTTVPTQPPPVFTSTRPTLDTAAPRQPAPAPYAPPPTPSLSPSTSPATAEESYYSPQESYESAASAASEASGGGARGAARQRPSTGTQEEVEAEAQAAPMSFQKKAAIAGGVAGTVVLGFFVRKWWKKK